MSCPWLLLIDIDQESKRTIEQVGEQLGCEVIIASRATLEDATSLKAEIETIVFQVDFSVKPGEPGQNDSRSSRPFAGLVFIGLLRPVCSELFAHLDRGDNVWMKQVVEGPLTERQLLSLLS